MNTAKARDLIERFRALGQGSLFEGWDHRRPDQQERLLADLEALDLTLFEELRRRLKEPEDPRPDFEPITCVRREAWSRNEEARRLGEDLVASGKAGFLVVAGGQASRLGWSGPKGSFPVAPLSGASLFQLFAEKILAARRRFGIPLYWYIMTSPLNHGETQAFFREHSFFGLPGEEVLFFPQGLVPSLTKDGMLLLAEDGSLFKNPDGHGGVIAALRRQGLLSHMRERGIEELYYFQVDNPLVTLPDFFFLGMHRLTGSEMASKVIPKAYPEEKLGVIARVNGAPGIIEYSDLDKDRMHARDREGNLLFSHGSIAVHLINVPFLAAESLVLPLHRALKKVKVLCPGPGKPLLKEREAIKLERFIFDALPQARNPLFFEAEREEEFAPLKNANGTDSIQTCRMGLIEKHSRWLEGCGVEVPRNDEGRPRHRVEISPLYAPDAEALKKRLQGTVNRIDGDMLFL